MILIISSVFLFLKNKAKFRYIDFKGGIMIEANFGKSPNLSDLRNQLDALTPGNVEIQEFGSETNVLIRIEKNSDVEDEQKNL